MPTCTPAAMATTTMSSVCHKCGIIAKSGKISCCGRSGSWFGNCGSVSNSNLDHTWYEGIQACKTLSQSKSAIGQKSHAAKQRTSSNGPGMSNLKAVIEPENTTTDITTTTVVIITHALPEEAISTYQGMWYYHDVSITIFTSYVYSFSNICLNPYYTHTPLARVTIQLCWELLLFVQFSWCWSLWWWRSTFSFIKLLLSKKNYPWYRSNLIPSMWIRIRM